MAMAISYKGVKESIGGCIVRFTDMAKTSSNGTCEDEKSRSEGNV